MRRRRRRAAQTLEDEAVRRARYGVSRPVLHRGEPVIVFNPETGIRQPLYETDYSDELLIGLLEANDKDRFTRRTETIDLLQLDPDKLTTKQLDRILKHLVMRLYENDPVQAEMILDSLGIDVPVDIRHGAHQRGGAIKTTAESVE